MTIETLISGQDGMTSMSLIEGDGNRKMRATETLISSPVGFISVDFVNAGYIKSQWQAHFCQVFPIEMHNLPKTHESDQAFFEKYWQGKKEWNGIPLDYRNFMLIHYPSDWTGKFVVIKKSGKPFKSGMKKGTVKRITINDNTGRPAYEMVEDGSVVDVKQCTEFKEAP